MAAFSHRNTLTKLTGEASFQQCASNDVLIIPPRISSVNATPLYIEARNNSLWVRAGWAATNAMNKAARAAKSNRSHPRRRQSNQSSQADGRWLNAMDAAEMSREGYSQQESMVQATQAESAATNPVVKIETRRSGLFRHLGGCFGVCGN